MTIYKSFPRRFFCPVPPRSRKKNNQAEGGEQERKPILGPEPGKAGELPGKGGKEQRAVGPFDLTGIQQEMEEAVQGQDQENLAAVPGEQGDGRREQQAEKETRLNDRVDPQINGIDSGNTGQQALENPRDIREQTAQTDPLAVRFGDGGLGQQDLYSEMGQGVRHTRSLRHGEKKLYRPLV